MIKALLADNSIEEIVIEKVAEHQVEITLDGEVFTPGAQETLLDDRQLFLSNKRGRGGGQLSRRELPALCNAERFVDVSEGVDNCRLHFICEGAQDKEHIL